MNGCYKAVNIDAKIAHINSRSNIWKYLKKKKWKKWMGGCNKAVTRDAPIAQTSINRHKVRLLHFLLFTFNFFIVRLLLNMSKVWKTLYWWISQFQLSILCGCGKPPYPASQPPQSQLNSRQPQICAKKSLRELTKNYALIVFQIELIAFILSTWNWFWMHFRL